MSMSQADTWLGKINLTTNDFPRYCDCYVNPQNSAQLVVMTGTGGHHRYCEVERRSQQEYEEFRLADHAQHDCTLAKHWKLTLHPSYCRDDDALWDESYAYFYFWRRPRVEG